MAITKTNNRMIDGSVVNVLDYGASPSETAANNTTYIQNAVNAANTAGGGTVYFPAGDYAIDGQITLYSNIELKGSVDTKLMPNDSVPLEAFKATSQSNIRIVDLIFEGTGTARTANQHLLKFDTCSEVQIHNCTFRKARESAVIIDNCDQGRMSECIFENNYYYGCEVRDGSVSWVISDCIFFENGSTGTATSAVGRGIVIWESFRINVTNCTFKNNTEYGLRFYSQSGDSDVDQQIAVSNCTFENNGTTAAGKIDLYIYNELGTIKNFAISNCTFRTRADNTALSLQGTNSVVSNCSFEAVVQDSGTAVNIFKATTASISNCVMQGFSNAFSMSSTQVPDNIRISNCQCIDCYRITAGVYGDQVVFDGNYFKQSSGGQTASETLITLPSGTTVVGARIINNTFDNAYRGIQFNIDDHTVDVSNNLFQNTSNLTIRAYGTDLSNLVFHGNTLDVATNPTELGRLELKGGQVARVEGHNNNDPVTASYGFSYRVGDRFYNINPTAGTATDMGWVCTVAGTPGTWKGFGDIAS